MSPYPALKTGDIVTVDVHGHDEFMVLDFTEHTVRIRRWPLTDAPPAEEVLRSQITVREGHE